MGIHFYQTASFERARSKILDYIFNSAMSFGMNEIKALELIQIFMDFRITLWASTIIGNPIWIDSQHMP